MKKLSLIITIISFSTVVSAQDLTNTIFDIVNTNSAKAWYKGQLRNKKSHGMGIRKTKEETLYIGDFSNGEISGYGMMLVTQENKIPNCNESVVYIGDWKNGKKSGLGTCYAENGKVIYSGKFENDKPVEVYPSEGEFLLRNFSLNEYDNGSKYWGEINDELYNGFGVYAWDNGDLWFGNFKEGERKGIGLYLTNDDEWAILNCNGDDCVQINSSIERKEKEAYHASGEAE